MPIDFHTHILPGIDDGSRNVEMSLRMLAAQREQQVDEIVATPHFYAQKDSVEEFLLRRQCSYEKLKTKMAETNLDQKLHLAAEVYYFQGIGSAGMIPKLCVEGTQTLLLEMPFAQWNSAIYADVEKLVRHQKLKVVLAHIERYYEFQKKKEIWNAVMELPVYRQMNAGDFSRITLFLTAIFYAIISYGTRILWKRHVLRNLRLGRKNSIVILTDWANLPQVREDIQHHSYELFQIRGIAVIDVNEKKTLPEKLGDIPFVAEGESVMDYLCHAWVDEVFIDLQPNDPRVDRWIDQLTEMGVTVHLKLANRMDLAANKQFVENLGRYTVLTTSIRTVSTWELFLKRLMDILGGIVGCILTAILFLILAPMIYHESPGPIFFGQTRIGKNGKKFTCYKFRSMYLDAEECKAALAAENRVSDGMMFKLDFDPRIIGSRRLPDGTIKKGIGNKIRDWSIDEFPQFWNVLKGDMSLVGTRPPTEDEWVKYELHYRSRLAIKPGITGMWQVSGRSEITDFEQVVALDRSYIANWSLGLDVKILCKTVGVVLRHEGAM